MSGLSIEKALEKLKRGIKQEAELVGRDPSEITLLAVSKKQSSQKIRDAIRLGHRDFGENYVQELLGRLEEFSDKNLLWHFIGRLQRNKCKFIVGKVALIHSVDTFALAEEISKCAAKLDIVQDILLQLNLSDEKSKGGERPELAADLLNSVRQLKGIRVRGLMALPPLLENPEDSRTYFRTLKSLGENLFEGQFELSMGTSHDYEVAIEEGATIIRVGTALFGERGGDQ